MRVALETFGCTVNQADSEAIARLLRAAGHELVAEGEAEAAVVNTCSVKTVTERRVLRRLGAIRLPLVVAGCLARADPEAVIRVRPDAALVGPRELDRVAEALASLGTGRPLRALAHRRLDKTGLGKERGMGVSARIPIAEGCTGACAYCQTRLARGPLFSFPREGVVAEARRALAEGRRELCLSAQDTAAYGADTGDDLASLASAVCELDGEFRVRIGMCDPGLVAPLLDGLLSLMARGRLYRFLHLPVQSGSDRVLADMGRRYTRAGFLEAVRRCREALGDLQLATDVIVGYPTEGEGDFEETLELLRLARPDIVNVTRFSPRPGTPAAGLPTLPGPVLRERSRRAAELCRSMQLASNLALVGATMRALVHGPGPKGGVLARTDAYRLMALPCGEPGSFVEARVTGATATYLVGVAERRASDGPP